jgi:glycosyltransferase involved in cell wall biosynthesis
MTMYRKDNAEYARLAIDSMINQTVKTNDFVLVCDGPLNEELDLLVKEYEEKYSIFHVHRLKENVGLGAALRYGVTVCQNSLIARMDDDDIAKPNRCEEELKEFEKDKTLSICGSFMNEFEVDSSKPIRKKKVPVTHNELLRYSRRRNPFNHSTVMFKKEDIITAGNYSTMRTNQDVDLWVRVLNKNYKGINIPIELVDFRFNSKTYQRRKEWKNIYLMIVIWKNFYKNHYCSLIDFLYVICLQLAIFIMPNRLLQWSYDHFR